MIPSRELAAKPGDTPQAGAAEPADLPSAAPTRTAKENRLPFSPRNATFFSRLFQDWMHLNFLQKPPPPTLCRWSDGFAPESGILITRAPADFMSVERWFLLQNRAYYSSAPPPTLGRWSGDFAPESGVLFIRAPADFRSVER